MDTHGESLKWSSYSDLNPELEYSAGTSGTAIWTGTKYEELFYIE
jgi:hypothetical protein